MTTAATRISPMSPRPRKHLDPKSKRFEIRFAIHLRSLLADRKLTATDFLKRLHAAGSDVTIEAVKKWLRGERLPKGNDMEAIGKIVGLKDYRMAWPPPA